MKRAAFSLLELLVVITLIAVLTSLIMGVVVKAQGRGNQTRCASNLRQLVGANLAYAAEHEGSYAPAQEPHNLVRWHGARRSIASKFEPEKGYLAPYLGRLGAIKLCPTLRDLLTGKQTFEEGTGGYGYNAAYIGGVPGDPFRPERMGNTERAAQTVMFSDTAFARRNGLQEYAYCEPWVNEWERGQFGDPLIASVHFRHDGLANVAWCDGHVTAEEPTQIDDSNIYGGDPAKWKLGWFGPKENNGYWRPY